MEVEEAASAERALQSRGRGGWGRVGWESELMHHGQRDPFRSPVKSDNCRPEVPKDVTSSSGRI